MLGPPSPCSFLFAFQWPPSPSPLLNERTFWMTPYYEKQIDIKLPLIDVLIVQQKHLIFRLEGIIKRHKVC